MPSDLTPSPLRRLPRVAALAAVFGLLGWSGLSLRAQMDPSPAPSPMASAPAPSSASADPVTAEAGAIAASDPATAALRRQYEKPVSQWPRANWDDLVAADRRNELGPMPEVVHPAENPYSKEKEQLGWQLFFDPRLSGSGHIACASCHDPDLAWADGRTLAFGHLRQTGRRNAPSVLNSGYVDKLFWDGRANSLEEQAISPIVASEEMANAEEVVVNRINAVAGYRDQFKKVFGVEQASMKEITQALACFQRTLVGGRSDFDRFLRGKHDALSDSAVRGLHVFRTNGRCINCHNGALMSDGQFHDIGLSYYGRKFEDLGRFNVTGRNEDVGKFRTPSLRNIARTGPYMHNGLFDLEGVLNMYNAGMPTLKRKADQKDDPKFPTKDKLLRQLNLTQRDMDDLTAFLQSLTEPRTKVRPPEIPK
jgi:cytochrome c peroxidase